jgi:hypothetical protein
MSFLNDNFHVVEFLQVKTQCILFARHAKVLKQYKYAGYPLLLEGLQVS